MEERNKNITILAIESSCDDTSASIIKNGEVLSNEIATQEMHRAYGGVVPELASRVHQENITMVVDVAMQKAGVHAEDLTAIAFTKGPGLMGSLLVGVSFAKGMSIGLGIPLIEVNHMEAHILAHFIDKPHPQFPFLCLTVSGGHTEIVRIDDHLSMIRLGKTLDDAAGEAFDKTGKMLGLDYPAGPIIDRLAREGSPVYTFPKPNIPDLDFSFSGLKTAILYFLRAEVKENPSFIEDHLKDICASVQESITQILLEKLITAAEITGIQEIAIAGGVSANSGLRQKVTESANRFGWNVYIPQLQYCTDNAAMIAMAAHYKFLAGQFAPLDISPDVRLGIRS
jgi:N6-L-threonylcarbamoyladenine synthase